MPHSIRLLPVVAALLALAACAPDDEDEDSGRPGDALDDGALPPDDGALPDDGTPTDNGTDGYTDDCAEGARWIYLVDSDATLIRFEPDTLTLSPVGTLNCAPGGFSNPFSMSVDRSATAWVLYSNTLTGRGNLFRASTEDASCEATSFVPNQEGLEVFGMGFVSDEAGGSAETLFVAGGASLSIGSGSSTLAWIDMGPLTVNPFTTLAGWPELTGTGNAELWGFFPDISPPAIQQIDKWDGSILRTFPLDALASGGVVEAWAFAFWGGDFWVFVKYSLDASTNIYKLETDDGSFTNVVPNTGRRIVGAGVSTCAPVVLI